MGRYIIKKLGNKMMKEKLMNKRRKCRKRWIKVEKSIK